MDFEVNGHKYKSKPLGVFEANHVLRRILPVLASIKDAFVVGADGQNPDGMKMLENAIVPLSRAAADMRDEDWDYVMHACLGVVQIQQGTAWANILASKQLMFDFIKLPDVLQIVYFVLQENFAGFLPDQPAQPTADQEPA